MPKAKLDAAFCAAATCPHGKKKVDYWDTAVLGFLIEVRPSGGKTYYLRYVDGNQRQRQLKIGKYESITFGAAKAKARKLRSEVELNGDPAATKEKKKAVPTYAELAQKHIEHVRTYQKRPENTESVLRVHLIPRFGKERIDAITSQDISAWLAEKRKILAPATCSKLRMLLGKSYSLAQEWSIPGSEVNPVRSVPRLRFSNSRERYLSAKEADRLLEACAQSSNSLLLPIVQLLLLTGARKSELLKAEWSNVDLERKTWFIPDSKTGKSRHVPLSKAAVAVIEGLPRFDGCPYLLPNPNTRKPYDTIKRAWATARELAGLGDFRLHDCRHSAASFWANSGADLFTIGRILGHADHQSTMRYAHLTTDTLMQAVEAGAAGMMGGAK